MSGLVLFLNGIFRSLLTKQAEEASIRVFLSNLRSLLLTPPHRNSTVLSIDPGFSHGCKLAVLSSSGSVLETAVIYPNFKISKNQECTAAGRKIAELINKHSVSTIAIGNGTACRETEALVSDVISNGKLSGGLQSDNREFQQGFTGDLTKIRPFLAFYLLKTYPRFTEY